MEKILFVDDEPNLLHAIERHLGRTYKLTTATSGAEGLILLEREGPFPVVVSDMRMPGMDGVEFLSTVRWRFPESIRLMLTGNADLDSAMHAVNEGQIFRFITKPCAPDALEKNLQAALRQHQLIRAEKELLENTLKGTLQVLIDILSLSNPVAFSRTQRIRHYTRQIAVALKLEGLWRFEVAAMLSQIGTVAVPIPVLEKYTRGEDLEPAERSMIERHPVITHQLLARIPRLEAIAQMILHQQDPFDSKTQMADVIRMGGQILRAAGDFDSLLMQGKSPEQALKAMSQNAGVVYDPAVLEVLKTVPLPTFSKRVITLHVHELQAGMVIEQEIRTRNGLLLVPKGQEITPAMLGLLANHFEKHTIADAVVVSVA